MNIQHMLKSFSNKKLLIAAILGGASLAVSAAPPHIKGYNIKPGNTIFPAQCDSLKVYFDRNKVLSATYEFRQNGKVIFSGKDDGKAAGLDHSVFAVNSTSNNNTREVCIAMAVDKTLVPGEVEFAVTSVTYLEGDDELTEKNLGSVKWNLTDMPRVSAVTPMWHPDKSLKDLKVSTGMSFSFDTAETNFGSYKDESSGTTVYIPMQVKGGKISLLQDDEVKAVINIEKTPLATTGKYNISLPQQKLTEEQAAKLHSGEVEIRLTEISYISPCNGKDMTVNDPEGLPTTWSANSYSVIPERAKTYARFIESTRIEKESITPLETEVLSYYAEDDDNGLISYTFTQPLAGGTSGNGDFVAKFRIGDANHEFDNVIPHTLSEDKKTLTLDLRGLSNGIPTLANNFKFVDDSGNSYIPATCTLFIENGLFDEKGQKVSVFCRFDSNAPGRYMDGQLWRIYPYKEISFATPTLSNALFYNGDAPEAKTETMSTGSNRMDITVSNSELIASAEPIYLVGETVIATTATHEGDIWSVVIPESVIKNGVEDLQFTLHNVTYTKVDGNAHIIAPINLSGFAPTAEFTTLAEVVALNPETEVVLNTNGLLVTISGENITAVEDNSAAVLLIDSDTGEPVELKTGNLLVGKLSGMYVGGNMLILDQSKSDYDVTEADASIGYEVADLEDCDKLIFRLLTFSTDEGFRITPYDDEQIVLMINETIPVFDLTGDLADFECNDDIKSVTGVYYLMEDNPMLLIRNSDDIKFIGLNTGVDSVCGNSDKNASVYNLNGVNVRAADKAIMGHKGIYVINGKKVMIF